MSITRSFSIALIILLAFSPMTFAAEEKKHTAEYRENYRFSLHYQSPEGENTTIEFVVAAQSFEISTFEPRLTFYGNILATDGSHIVLQYNLKLERQIVVGHAVSGDGQNPFQTVSRELGGLTSNVRLRLGTSIEILSVGKEKAQLIVSKVD